MTVRASISLPDDVGAILHDMASGSGRTASATIAEALRLAWRIHQRQSVGERLAEWNRRHPREAAMLVEDARRLSATVRGPRRTKA